MYTKEQITNQWKLKQKKENTPRARRGVWGVCSWLPTSVLLELTATSEVKHTCVRLLLMELLEVECPTLNPNFQTWKVPEKSRERKLSEQIHPRLWEVETVKPKSQVALTPSCLIG